jgi:hypothetical protein
MKRGTPCGVLTMSTCSASQDFRIMLCVHPSKRLPCIAHLVPRSNATNGRPPTRPVPSRFLGLQALLRHPPYRGCP